MTESHILCQNLPSFIVSPCPFRYPNAMKTILHFIVLALAIGLSAYLLPGVQVTMVSAILVALVLSLLNVFLKPILVILTLPINILTLGLFTFVINALIIMLVSYIVPGFHVASFWWALLFSVVLAIINMLFHKVTKV